MSLSTESPRPLNLSKQKTIHDEPSKAIQNHLTASYERRDTEHSSVESQNAVLACHRVPGLWFIKLASNALDILNCTFHIDHETAKKWNIPQIKWVFSALCSKH
ncbi:hypothetical protein GALMADRAFT_247348 [Galerina marginata CBS 339.88]|uniref:Uncharacterized protein n=1 Tax=Galerina marginata (strain CBS 339.88) TaxID=685588 RepID=A0A067TAV9_GALM3|nr:hypothetical protein GALMADRAFT_247348 [Galerina marginata CBS 339.88]